jgi:hypothetical protein
MAIVASLTLFLTLIVKTHVESAQGRQFTQALPRIPMRAKPAIHTYRP